MYIYIYNIYIQTHTYTRTHLYTYVQIYIQYIHTFTHTHTHTHIYIHMYMHIYMHSFSVALMDTTTTLQPSATIYNKLQHTATHCSTLQHTATHCSTLQHTATHCNTLQHTATHCQVRCQVRGSTFCRKPQTCLLQTHTCTPRFRSEFIRVRRGSGSISVAVKDCAKFAGRTCIIQRHIRTYIHVFTLHVHTHICALICVCHVARQYLSQCLRQVRRANVFPPTAYTCIFIFPYTRISWH